jgi:hypothetical protein
VLKKHPNAITQQQIDEKSRFLGTRFGKSRIPERWLSKLKVAPELTGLADQLYRQL